MRTLRNVWSVIAGAALVAVLIFYRGSLGDVLHAARIFLGSSFEPPVTREAIQALTLENQRLRSEVNDMQAGIARQPRLYAYHTAKIYSRYPFNDRSLLYVDAGSEDGIVVGAPVLVAEGVLLGRVTSVRRTQAEVETIFSALFKSSVIIGASQTKAVLQGGTTPRLELISQDAPVVAGDAIRTISPEFPIGMFLGTLVSLQSNEHDVWRSALLEVPYTDETLTHVLIVSNFP